MLLHQCCQVIQLAGDNTLLTPGAVLNNGDWCLTTATGNGKLLLNMCGFHQAHIDHQGLIAFAHAMPVWFCAIRPAMASNKLHALCIVTVCQWYTGIGGTTCGSRNARYHLKRNVMWQQRLDFFAAAAEDKRVATF